MGKSYKGRISEEEYQGLSFVIIITKEGAFRVENLFEEYVDNGEVYLVTIKKIPGDDVRATISMPLTAERDLVPV